MGERQEASSRLPPRSLPCFRNSFAHAIEHSTGARAQITRKSCGGKEEIKCENATWSESLQTFFPPCSLRASNAYFRSFRFKKLQATIGAAEVENAKKCIGNAAANFTGDNGTLNHLVRSRTNHFERGGEREEKFVLQIGPARPKFPVFGRLKLFFLLLGIGDVFTSP